MVMNVINLKRCCFISWLSSIIWFLRFFLRYKGNIYFVIFNKNLMIFYSVVDWNMVFYVFVVKIVIMSV